MPTYEYICNDCSTHYEKLVRSNGEAIECPHCGSAKKTLQFSTFSASGGGSPSADAGACAAPACMRTPRGCGCH